MLQSGLKPRAFGRAGASSSDDPRNVFKIGSDAPEGCVLHSSRRFRICFCVYEGCPRLPLCCCERLLMGGTGS
eukprot:4570049-Alexandrium_andersonii.AAC.1